MSEEILVNVTPRETRAALVENGVLHEVIVERTRRRGQVGNIYKGRVLRILPGLQAAFLDIGLERSAFLHIAESGMHPGENGAAAREGDALLVQVVKDPIGTKGARLVTQLSIPARYLVLLPAQSGVAVSARIEDETERGRLKALMQDIAPSGHGYIVRTAAEGVDEAALRADLVYLERLWQTLCATAACAAAGSMVHEDLPLALRVLRDYISPQVEKLRVDSRETHAKMRAFARQFMPEAEARIEHYLGARPIFDLYGVEDEIQKALNRRVELKSGGYLIIDPTEALTTIDVNTGAYVGQRNPEETGFKTNLEACQAIARQLRLRNLGGTILIDFIGMEAEEHRRQVWRTLEKALEPDHARTHLGTVSPMGLVEMTRKRTRENLAQVLCEPCPTCAGRGAIKTAETVCYEIFRELLRAARQFDAGELLVLAAPEVVGLVLDEESASVAQLEDFIGKRIRFQAESGYAQEQYDVVLR